MTEILDESAVSEIEARKPFYFCDKCGYFGDTGPRHQHATGHPPFECRYNAVRPTSELTIDALCATVKHLRAEDERLRAQLGVGAYRNAEVARLNDQLIALQSQLEQLRAENDELTGIIVTHGDTIVKLAERFAQVEQERDALRDQLRSARRFNGSKEVSGRDVMNGESVIDQREERVKNIREHVQARPQNYHPDFHFLLSEVERLRSELDDREHEERVERYMAEAD